MSPLSFAPMPPGERTPEQVGIVRPSGVIFTHQPRYLFLLLKEPVKQSVTQILPSLSNLDPKAYSW